MKDQRIVMGMPVTVEIPGTGWQDRIEAVFRYFAHVEETFSPFKATSETSLINRGVPPAELSDEMQEVMRLATKAKAETDGYFDVYHEGKFNPVGLVKGWAVHHEGVRDFYIEAGGDIQLAGLNEEGGYWAVGIRNPFEWQEVVKVLYLSDTGIATSGTYVRGEHIYDPHSSEGGAADIVSLSVIGPNVYEADIYATAAFAMGPDGIYFIEDQPGFEGYMIEKDSCAVMTSGLEHHLRAPWVATSTGVAR
jgi:thiamine biosynthesis lipoprotein